MALLGGTPIRAEGYYWVRIDSRGCSPQVGEFSHGYREGEWRIQGEWIPDSRVIVLSQRLVPHEQHPRGD
jgi:hypothetical protein